MGFDSLVRRGIEAGDFSTNPLSPTCGAHRPLHRAAVSQAVGMPTEFPAPPSLPRGERGY